MQHEQGLSPIDPVKEAMLKALFQQVWAKWGHLSPEEFEALLFYHADAVITRYLAERHQPLMA